MDGKAHKHYIRVDSESRVVEGWSSGPHQSKDTGGAILLTESGLYHFEPCPLYNEDGIPLYKWDGSQIIERTTEEIEADRAELPEPEPVAPAEDSLVWDELDAAYQEGVDSV